MAKSRFVLNHAGVEELLKVAAVPMLEAAGERIAAAAGEGFEAETFIGAHRARVTVRTATVEAMVAEATDRALSRAIGSAGG